MHMTERKIAYAFHPTFDGKPAGAPEIYATPAQAYRAQRASHVSGPVRRTTVPVEVHAIMSEGKSYRQALRILAELERAS
jgi:hypothetical protein